MSELEKQIEQERRELDGAVKIPISQFQPRAHGESGRCGWCGRWSDDLVAVPDYGPPGMNGEAPGVANVRYKGVKCCGGRHL